MRWIALLSATLICCSDDPEPTSSATDDSASALELALDPAAITVERTGTATVTVRLTRTNLDETSVALALPQTLPAGVAAALDSAETFANEAVLTITTTEAEVGQVSLSIDATTVTGLESTATLDIAVAADPPLSTTGTIMYAAFTEVELRAAGSGEVHTGVTDAAGRYAVAETATPYDLTVVINDTRYVFIDVEGDDPVVTLFDADVFAAAVYGVGGTLTGTTGNTNFAAFTTTDGFGQGRSTSGYGAAIYSDGRATTEGSGRVLSVDITYDEDASPLVLTGLVGIGQASGTFFTDRSNTVPVTLTTVNQRNVHLSGSSPDAMTYSLDWLAQNTVAVALISGTLPSGGLDVPASSDVGVALSATVSASSVTGIATATKLFDTMAETYDVTLPAVPSLSGIEDGAVDITDSDVIGVSSSTNATYIFIISYDDVIVRVASREPTLGVGRLRLPRATQIRWSSAVVTGGGSDAYGRGRLTRDGRAASDGATTAATADRTFTTGL